ncbi:MAG: SDR family NAD(P)-dependent oxidoreductase [Ardenticatenaceae bacterium]|nr:SDR family NAD(P)-dependent oxidoreductase [Ardenticatenaceae bacterium]
MNPQQTVIITGGNSGLGYACAENLAKNKTWHIVLAVRDLRKGKEAIKRLQKSTGNSAVSQLQVDLASLDSVRQFAISLAESHLPPLKALVNNAGLQVYGDTRLTEEGFEMTFGVNHLGPYLLTHLLLKQMVPPGRIVFVSSGTHDPDTIDGRMAPPRYVNAKGLAYPDQNGERQDEGSNMVSFRRYTTSKLCNVYTAYEFSRRLFAEGHSSTPMPITVNAFDPGAMLGTGLTREWHPWLRSLTNLFRILQFIPMANVHSVDASGAALADLIINPKLAHRSGRYFQGRKEVKSSRLSYDQRKAIELWQASAEFVNLQMNETILKI